MLCPSFFLVTNGYYLRVVRILGLLDGTVASSNPLNTTIGRLRADEDTPKRAKAASSRASRPCAGFGVPYASTSINRSSTSANTPSSQLERAW